MKKIAQQGEVVIYEIDGLPDDLETKIVDKNGNGDWIISHSESGHHHVVGGGADVMERTNNVPAGMRILYGIMNNPNKLSQTVSGAHDPVDLTGKFYEFRISREYDPFAEQARIVAD